MPARLAGQDGAGVRAEAGAAMADLVLPGRAAAAIVERFGLASDDLLLHLLPLAGAVARAPISGFRVAAVGRVAGSGDVLLGGNLEWPGASLHHTVHAEGFVAVRAWQRGGSLETLAVTEAHPCAHCRQVLAEFAASAGLVLIDPLGHRLDLDRLYPWPFDPAVLDQPGAGPGPGTRPDLRLPADLPPGVASLLGAAGRRAHAPYSGCPAAVVLEVEGALTAGAGLESVAFNPTLSALQTALVALVAGGRDPARIARAWLAQVPAGKVDLAASTRELLAAVAPGATLTVVGWAL